MTRNKRSRAEVSDEADLPDMSSMDVEELMRGDFLEDLDNNDSEGGQSEEMADESSEEDSSDDEQAKKKKAKIQLKNPETPTKSKKQNADSSVSSDSGEEDEEALAKHEAELQNLAKDDPEFYKYLQKHDAGLLDFKDNEDSEDDEDDDEGENQGEDEEEEEQDEGQATTEEGETAAVPVSSGQATELTMESLKEIEQTALVNKSSRGLKRLMAAFRSGAFLGAEEGGNLKYTVSSSEVHSQLMSDCLQGLHEAFYHHLLGPGTTVLPKAPDELKQISGSKNWKFLKPLLQSFFRALLHMLTEVKDLDLQMFITQAIEKYLPFLALLPRASRLVLKALLEVWGRIPANKKETQHQFLAYLRIRQMANTIPPPFIDQALKGLYLSYARCAHKRLAASSGDEESLMAAAPLFMANCITEAYGLDLPTAYQLAFGYIRQLGLHLRNAMVKKTEDSCKKVYNWQFLKCLQVWVNVISAYPGEHELRPLLFPLTQIVLGVVKLIPSYRFIPLRFYCVRLLQQLAACAEVYIPSAEILLEILRNPELQKKPKPSTDAAPDLKLIYKIGKESYHTKAMKDVIVTEAMSLLDVEVEIYRYTVAFPEFAFPIAINLRKFVKSTKISRWKAFCQGILEKIQKNSEFVKEQRLASESSPFEANNFEPFKPEETAHVKLRISKQEGPNIGEMMMKQCEGNKSTRENLESSKLTLDIIPKELEDDERTETKKKKKYKKNGSGGSSDANNIFNMGKAKAKSKESSHAGNKTPQVSLETQKDEVEDFHWSDDESSESG